MIDLLNEYGIDPARVFSGDSTVLVDLRKVYEAQVAEQKGSNEIGKEEFTALRNAAKSNADAIAATKVAVSAINEAIYGATDTEYDSLVLLIDELSEILSEMKHEAKEWVANKNVTPEQRATERKSQEEKYENASKLRELIMLLWGLMKDSLDLTDETFSEKGEFPLKDSVANGRIPNLSRKPDKPGAKKKGRTTTTSQRRYAFNGTEFPAGTLPTEIAKEHVSSDSFHVTLKDIQAKVKADGFDFMKDDWSVKFDTGELKAWTVKQAKKETAS